MSALNEKPEDAARALGLVCVFPRDNELFIDLDDAESRDVMDAMLRVLEEIGYSVTRVKETESKSGNAHAYLQVAHTLSPVERIALQACLGSDRKRELLSLLRVWGTNRAPTVFFEKPAEVGTRK